MWHDKHTYLLVHLQVQYICGPGGGQLYLNSLPKVMMSGEGERERKREKED